jgi:hypothetical protein
MQVVPSGVATLYFDNYRTYCAFFTWQDGVPVLEYLNATTQPVNWSAADFSPESPAMEEIRHILAPLKGKARTLGVALPMDSVVAHHIPYSGTLTTDELRRIIRLEACEHLPNEDSSHFTATVYPLYGFASNPFTAMSVLLPSSVVGVAENAAAQIGAELQRVVSAQTAAHTAFGFHYPEERGVVALCGVQRGHIDIAVARNSALLHVGTISLENEFDSILREITENDETPEAEAAALAGDAFGRICRAALGEAAASVQAQIERAYFFGADLTKAALDEAAATLPMPVKRLNPLRRMKTTLDQRLQQYASRVAHILVPSVGAALPEIQAGIVLTSYAADRDAYSRKTA